MAADFTLTTRVPTIRFPRPQSIEIGSKVSLYWNGAVAPNGDGMATGGSVDFSKPIAGPMRIWLEGHRSTFGGGFGLGGFAEAGANNDQSMGFGAGPFGIGAFSVGGGFLDLRQRRSWRNGQYIVEARVIDDTGNEQQTILGTITIDISAVPRPSPKAEVTGFDSQTSLLTIGFSPSPDFEP